MQEADVQSFGSFAGYFINKLNPGSFRFFQGFSGIFGDLGVDHIVEGGQTMNPSIEDILDAVEKVGAKNVFVLPNNSNVILAASQAAELSERNVVVLPTKNVAMGIGAVIAFNPEASVEENREAMTAAAEQVKTGQITFAVRDTVFEDKEIKEGDLIGIHNGRIEVVGKSIDEISVSRVAGSSLTSGGFNHAIETIKAEAAA